MYDEEIIILQEPERADDDTYFVKVSGKGVTTRPITFKILEEEHTIQIIYPSELNLGSGMTSDKILRLKEQLYVRTLIIEGKPIFNKYGKVLLENL
ncbi:hypothetical protein [Bacillus cereus]|uniref:hypothetical protein n=1 Tax=Bacillus cereus TaxID=1396 RepID=UPI000B4B99CF|nr:hypothetical protein [Bacillus cereus]PFS97579.1 hypothetical protein COK58_15310 [Bacillus cereus]